MKKIATTQDLSDPVQNALPKRNYHGWKRPDKDIEYQDTVIIPTENYVERADTTIQGLLSAGVTPQLTKNYSGDIPDMSYASTQEIKTLQKSVNSKTEELKADAKTILENHKKQTEYQAEKTAESLETKPATDNQ